MNKNPDRYDIIASDKDVLINPEALNDPVCVSPNGSMIESKGPRTVLFTLRGPSGFTISVPARGALVSRDGDTISFHLPYRTIEKFFESIPDPLLRNRP